MATKLTNEMLPYRSIPVGEYIEDDMKSLGLKQNELAQKLEMPASNLNSIIKGKRRITAEIAIKLEGVFGTPANIWLGLQSQYDIEMVRRSLSDKTKKRTVIANSV